VSLLQSTPLILLFQHNNLKSNEWVGIRRELTKSLKKVDDQLAASAGREFTPLSTAVKLQIIQTNIFEPALRIAEYYNPLQPQDPATFTPSKRFDPALTHALSESAYHSSKAHRNRHELTPLFSGPIAVLTFPTVSPQHVHAALSTLSPHAPDFPAPTRRLNPGYWDPPVQDGLKRLILLGARIEGRVFDADGTRWVGGIEGGIDGLRAQLVGMLQGFSGGLAATLEGASRSLWFTMEGRRNMLEKEQKPKDEEGKVEEKKDA
jgi:large subunit ribosomal protein L10